jgi:hypothetical protein
MPIRYMCHFCHPLLERADCDRRVVHYCAARAVGLRAIVSRLHVVYAVDDTGYCGECEDNV